MANPEGRNSYTIFQDTLKDLERLVAIRSDLMSSDFAVDKAVAGQSPVKSSRLAVMSVGRIITQKTELLDSIEAQDSEQTTASSLERLVDLHDKVKKSNEANSDRLCVDEARLQSYVGSGHGYLVLVEQLVNIAKKSSRPYDITTWIAKILDFMPMKRRLDLDSSLPSSSESPVADITTSKAKEHAEVDTVAALEMKDAVLEAEIASLRALTQDSKPDVNATSTNPEVSEASMNSSGSREASDEMTTKQQIAPPIYNFSLDNVPALESALASPGLAVVYCTSNTDGWSMSTHLSRIAKKYPSVRFYRLRNNIVPSLAQAYGLEDAPEYIVFRDDGALLLVKYVDRVGIGLEEGLANIGITPISSAHEGYAATME